MSASLELQRITQRFAGSVALDGIGLTMPAGAYVVLLGPSGSGKTTLLSVLGGFLMPTEGRVLIDGTDVTELPPAKRPTTTVFQDYALFPHLSVAGNVGFGLEMRGVSRAVRQSRIGAVLELVGLGGLERRRIYALSGGQRQRVALARALVVEPAVLLLDEPLGALDVALRRQVQGELKALQRRVGTTFVHVTHDQEEAMALADLLVVMNHGRIEDAGPPERVYLRPRTRFTATFLGDSNLIEGCVAAVEDGWVELATASGLVRTAGHAVVGDTVSVAVRPEQLVLGDAHGLWSLGAAVVGEAMFLGAYWRVRAACEPSGLDLLLHLPPTSSPRLGDRLPVSVHPDDLALVAR
ncbi:MAG: ABC transporter ATP-binding protein [Geminicoccaceae bacterium]